MDAPATRGGKGVFEGLYRFLMRRNSVYVTFVIAGAFLGERVGFVCSSYSLCDLLIFLSGFVAFSR